ncbi:S26 family signal peptidase [Nonomuraea sp. TT08I-71]|nr:S26 family signal peptidase [Nonomuraea sp. TT08I-71]
MTGWLRRRWRLVVVRGSSMAPTLRDGDRLVVRVGRAPAPGDVVVFRARDVVPDADLTWMVKRVHRVEPDGAVTVRGDNARSQDSRHFGAVPPGAILGVARWRR